MIVGNPMLRNRTLVSGSPEANALTFRCFSENFGGNTAAPGGGTDTVTLPPKICRGGIRTNIYFPSYGCVLVMRLVDTNIFFQVLGWKDPRPS